MNRDVDERVIELFRYQLQGDSWKAMRTLKELTFTYPNEALYHKLLGNLYFHMGLLDWAVDYYQRAVEIDPDYIDAHYDLGVALFHRARVNPAVAAFQKVLTLDKNYHAAHYRLALCYQHLGRLNAAIKHFQESIVVNPEYVMAHYHLGEIYFEQGEYEKAENAFARVLQEDADDSASSKYQSLIRKKMSVVHKSNSEAQPIETP